MPTAFMEQARHLPALGYGIGLKDSFAPLVLEQMEIVDPAEQIEWVEIIAENYLSRGGRSLERLKQLLEAGLPVVSHGVNLSIGSAEPLNETYLADLERLFALVQPPWFSDHLCFGSHGGHYANDLLPLPITEASAEQCVKNIRQLKERFAAPFLIENISTYVEVNEAGWTEARWLRLILEEADCGLLLDVNNVFVNAHNHGGDALDFIKQLPLERVIEIHMAGHLERGDLLIDTHGEDVRPEVLALFAETLPLCPNVKGILLERDSNVPPFETLMAEMNALRQTGLDAMAKRSLRQETAMVGYGS